MRRPQSFVVLPFSAQVASGTRFWTLPGSVLGASWLPRWLKPLLDILLGRPRAVPNLFVEAPEASKSAPRAPQEASKIAPRVLHEAETLQGSALTSPACLYYTAILSILYSHSISLMNYYAAWLVTYRLSCFKSSRIAKQRFGKAALGRPLARMRPLDRLSVRRHDLEIGK